VVLISDGGANVGVTDEALIGGEAGTFDVDGVYLVGVGVGTASSYNDTLMDTVTDLGRGAAVFVDSGEEAWKMFFDRFSEVMDIAAREVEVRLDLPPTFEIVTTSAEEVSTDRTEIEPQHIAPNDTMVFFQHIASCDPSTVSDDTPLTVLVTWKDDRTFLPVEIERTWTFGELLGAPVRQLRRGAAIFAYAEALRTGQPAEHAAALSRLAEAEVEYPGDPELAEIRAVLEAL
jgi:Ca-activated chloride channel homolog